ncbi:MAG: hypothetical protein V4531_10450 [Actinomycetota bacterium]
MVHDTGVDEHHEDKFVHFINWLNTALSRRIGTADLGPYNDVVEQVGEAVCPICGTPMAKHSIDRSSANAVLNCPIPHLPQAVRAEPINEFGMPKRVR